MPISFAAMMAAMFTYEDYWSLSGRIANALCNASVKAGDRVAVQVAQKC